jgi:hypothetical protein
MHKLLKDVLISIPTQSHLTLGYNSTGEGWRKGKRRGRDREKISKN